MMKNFQAQAPPGYAPALIIFIDLQKSFEKGNKGLWKYVNLRSFIIIIKIKLLLLLAFSSARIVDTAVSINNLNFHRDTVFNKNINKYNLGINWKNKTNWFL